jgi:hypothetical protein
MALLRVSMDQWNGRRREGQARWSKEINRSNPSYSTDYIVFSISDNFCLVRICYLRQGFWLEGRLSVPWRLVRSLGIEDGQRLVLSLADLGIRLPLLAILSGPAHRSGSIARPPAHCLALSTRKREEGKKGSKAIPENQSGKVKNKEEIGIGHTVFLGGAELFIVCVCFRRKKKRHC